MNLHALPACSPDAFERRYAEHPDPWRFATSEYERARYAITVNALRRTRYRRAFEPGCSIGELTAQLAQHCDEVLATEVSATALAQARARCTSLGNVELRQEDLRDFEPRGELDLIVLSEIGYYFPRDQLADIAIRLARALAPGGQFLAVHWTGRSEDHVLHGDEVQEVLASALPLVHDAGARHEGFRLDSWVRA